MDDKKYFLASKLRCGKNKIRNEIISTLNNNKKPE